MKRKIFNILTVLLIGLSSCLGSVYPQYTPIKAETTEISSDANSQRSSNQLLMNEGELDIEVVQEVQKDKQHVTLKVTANTDDEVIRINGIRGPDGTIKEGDETTYTAPCNGTYEFEVFYEKTDAELSQFYYVYVFDSNRMTDGNKPSKANGYSGDSDVMMMDVASGTIYTKLYNHSVTVDDQNMGPGHLHYVAYMQDANGESIMCMDPNASAGNDFNKYSVEEITSGTKSIRGKNDNYVPHSELAEIWFYAQIMGQKISGLSYSVDDWTFICQIMLWSKLGYTISGYDSNFQKGIDWVNTQIGQHATYKSLSGEARQLEVWVNDLWPEGTETLDAGRYVNKDGKLNTSGTWIPFNPETTVLSFGDPKYIWGSDYVINTEEQDQDGNKVTVITSITGGKISVRNKQNIADQYYPLYKKSTESISISYDKSDGFMRYDFARKNSLKDVETLKMSTSQEQFTGTSYSYSAENLQRIMQFKMPEDDIIQFSLPFSEEPNAEVVPPVEQPKDIKAPVFIKKDSEDGFPVQGATFVFYAGQNYQIHFQQRHAVIDTPAGCSGSGDQEVCWDDSYKWGDWSNGPTKTVWSNGTEIFEDVTPSDGRIDTSPIIKAYYDKAKEIIDAQLALNKPLGDGGVEYQQHENYLDKEGTGWIGGQFYAQEPDTSQNTCNDSAAGACNPEYDGYLNLHPWEKIRFEIGTNVSDDAEVIHENDRQKGRFTVHKVDAESNYLNHNNNHEPQGDGYFYGSVFIVTAREDVVLHDGTIAKSVFTGNPLNKGEVADVLVLQLPLKDDGTYDTDYLNNLSSTTTQMLDLGELAVQEVRWPGVYKEDLPLVYDDKDGLWHVDPAQADDVLSKLKDKTSKYYQFDYDKAAELYQEGILPINSPDGGYWFKDYTNGIVNTTNPEFIGGQTISVDIKYVGQDKAYNEIIPAHDKTPGQVTVNGEEMIQMIPDENYSITRGEPYEFTVNAGLDYENSIQKGHIQFKKILTQKTGIENGDNTGIVDKNNIPAADVYFAIYLDRKANQTIKDTTEEPTHLPDQYYASKRLDGLEYVFDNKGNFELYAEDKVNGAVTGYHPASADEIEARKGLVMVYTDQTQTTMKPADNYYEWKLVEISDKVSAVMKLNTFINPSKAQDGTALTDQNLSKKDLYMVLKTNVEGKAGTNMPETIVWANNAAINGLINTVNGGSTGDWDYQTALSYDKSHAEVLAYLQESGLPLPYGTYTLVEMNAPEGYEGVSWKAEITKNLTTYDINEDATEWELGIEKGVDGGYLRGNENPLGWFAKQRDVKGDGTAKDETWYNKQYHIFSDYVSTSVIGNNIEDKLHKQMLQVVKIDAETGKSITVDNADFMIWQWNSNLALNDEYKHAIYDNQTKTWTVNYDVPEYYVNGNITDTKRYDGTEYYIDSKGLREILGQWIKVPAGSSGVYTTDAEGMITLEQPIPVGNYFLLETKSPEGYLQNKEPISFDIAWNGSTTEPNEEDFINVPLRNEDGSFVCQPGKDCNDPDSDDYAYDQYGNAVLENVQTEKAPNFVTIIISAEDKPQKGYVEVEKRGSIFDKFVQYTTDLLEMIGFKPTWKDDQVINLNTSFCLYAEEDIYLNDDLKYKTDECIQKMNTDKNGYAYSEPIYLGKYYVTECDAPHGYITNQEKMHFELTYDGEVQIVHPTFEALVNERQKLQIELYKTDEQRRPLADAIFGIYAAEDLPVAFEEENVSLKPTTELLPQQMLLKTNIDGTATLTGVDYLDNYRVIIPEKVKVEGQEYTITAIGKDALNGAGLQGLLLPPTISFVGDGAFLNNQNLDYLEFTSEKAPLFESKNIFPTGKWEQKCTEGASGIVCDLVFNPAENSLLGIYIPWSSLASYDLAKIGSNGFNSMADNDGVKDNRLMGILLKDSNNGHEEIDESFNGIRFDSDGFSNLGIVENTVINLMVAELIFDLTEATKKINDDEISGYFITNYKGVSDTVTIPEAILVDGKEIRVVGIEQNALTQKELKEILVPDSIQYIGSKAFAENEELTTIRFYETEYQSFIDETGNGSTNVDDDMMLNKAEESCGMSGGSWKDSGDGTYACAYTIPSQKESDEAECIVLNGSYADGICSYNREVFGEMPEDNLDNEMNTDVTDINELDAGIALLDVGVIKPQIAGNIKSNSQIACEALGNTWDALTGTCSSELKSVQPTDPDIDPDFSINQSRIALYIDESAFDYTPQLTWIIVGENNYERFDQAFILSSDTVITQDEKLDGYLYWNPDVIDPINGTAGYWDFGVDLPALLDHPLTLNQLINEDPIDGGMVVNPPLPAETTGIPAGTLIEVVKTDSKGHALTQFDYPEGKYMVKELKAPEGYLLSYQTYLVELKYQDNDAEVIKVAANDGNPIINKKAEEHPLRIDIFKVDGNTLKGLAGAEFELWDHQKGTVLETLITDSTGHAVTKGLYNSNEYSGHLWLKETKAPEGYEISGDGWHKVDINSNASAFTTLITVKNYKPDEPHEPDNPSPSSKEVSIRLQLIKSLEKDKLYENEHAWKDVQFGIYAAEDLYTDSKKKNLEYQKDELIFTSGIDKNGSLNILWKDSDHKICDGDYYLKEIKTSNDYIINDQKHYFRFDRAEEGSYKVVEINDLKPIINHLKRTNVKIVKVDEQNQTKHLSEAEFVLVKDKYDVNGDEIIDEQDAIAITTSDEEGYAYFDDLPDGIWWIKETKAPKGYDITASWKKLTIKGTEVDIEAFDEEGNQIPFNNQERTVIITWSNTSTQDISEIMIPSTGVNLKEPIYWFLLVTSALFILILKLKEN